MTRKHLKYISFLSDLFQTNVEEIRKQTVDKSSLLNAFNSLLKESALSKSKEWYNYSRQTSIPSYGNSYGFSINAYGYGGGGSGGSGGLVGPGITAGGGAGSIYMTIHGDTVAMIPTNISVSANSGNYITYDINLKGYSIWKNSQDIR